MKQLEIEFFWPLTEQTELDLDFTPSVMYDEQKRREKWNYNTLTINPSGTYLGVTSATIAPNFEFRPNPNSVGYWQVSPEVKYYVTAEPNWLVKKMTKLLLGWKWGKN